MLSLHSVLWLSFSGDAKSDHWIKVISAKLFHSECLFPLVVNKYLMEGVIKLLNNPFLIKFSM